MAMIDTALMIAGTQTKHIAKMLGRDPKEITAAINKGKEVLPQIMNSQDGGTDVLNKLGVDKKFLNDIHKRFGKYGSKVGLNSNAIESAIGNIGNNLNKNGITNDIVPPRNNAINFDAKKYPKL